MANKLLVAGVDFGTTFTKVVVRDNNNPAVDAQVVPGPKRNGLMPSELYLHNGEIQFSKPSRGEFTSLKYLKMLAAHLSEKQSMLKLDSLAVPAFKELCQHRTPATVVQDLMTYYLYGIVQETHDFIRSHSDWADTQFDQNNSEDLLIFQLAVPTGLMQTIGRTEKMFRESLAFAQALVSRGGFKVTQPVPYENIAKVVDDQRQQFQSGSEQSRWYLQLTRIYPEVAAGAQTLLQSPNVKDGLYITMDVGGGTIDLNAFRRFSGFNQEFDVPRLDYYAAKVSPLGAERLPDRGSLDVFKTESQLMDKVFHSISALLKAAMRKQPNHGGQRGGKKTWDEALIITMGGGVYCSSYTETMEKALFAAGIDLAYPVHLPPAPDVIIPTYSRFTRFGVANGMSYLSDNLEDFRFPHEIVDFWKIYGNPHFETPTV